MSNYQTPPQTERYFNPESIQAVTAARLQVVERGVANAYYSDPSVLAELESAMETPFANENPLEALLDQPIPDTAAEAEAIDQTKQVIDSGVSALVAEAVNEAENILTTNDTLIDQLEQDAYIDQLPTLEQLRSNVERARQNQEGSTDVPA